MHHNSLIELGGSRNFKDLYHWSKRINKLHTALRLHIYSRIFVQKPFPGPSRQKWSSTYLLRIERYKMFVQTSTFYTTRYIVVVATNLPVIDMDAIYAKSAECSKCKLKFCALQIKNYREGFVFFARKFTRIVVAYICNE